MNNKRQQFRLSCVAGVSILLFFMQINFLIHTPSDAVTEVNAPSVTTVVETSEPTPIDTPAAEVITTPNVEPTSTIEPIIKIDEIPEEAEPPTEEIEPSPEDVIEMLDYNEEDAMCIANMIFGEIACVAYDKHYTVEEQDHIMQEWACIPLNHVKAGIADSIPAVIKLRLPSGYYVWHPRYATQKYADNAKAKSPELYERCLQNTIIVLTGQMVDPVPEDVIYASLTIYGELYKSYKIDTGYYRSTAYLSKG